MRLLDKSFTYQEKRNILDSLNGNISRVCVSDDVEEIISSLGFAVDNLNMIAYSRIKELKEKDDKK